MRIKQILASLSVLTVAAVAGYQALAATTSVTANIRFDTPLNVSTVTDIDFASVTAGNASTYRVSTAGAVSTVAGTGSVVLGSPNAGSVSISGSATQAITIATSGYTAQGGVTPSAATCAYDGGAAAACDGAGIVGAAPAGGKTLLVGVDVAVDGSQSAGDTATPSFTVTVLYQ